MSFERTLGILADRLRARLRPEYRSIWVQGNNKGGGSRLLFTIFTKDDYTMRFLDVRNFRNYRFDGNIEEEDVLIERQIESFRTTLQEFINYE
jgi:hypothetical protein